MRGKIIFRELCDKKAPWDQPLSLKIEAKWLEWKEALPKELSVPRAFKMSHNEVKGVWLHTFADASKDGVCAARYVVVTQSNREV